MSDGSDFQLKTTFLQKRGPYPKLTLGESETLNWLDAGTPRLNRLALDDLYWQIWRNVPLSAGLTDLQTFNMVQLWALDKGLTVPPFTMGPTPGSSVPLPAQPAPATGNPRFNSAASDFFGKLLEPGLNFQLRRPSFYAHLDFDGLTLGLRKLQTVEAANPPKIATAFGKKPPSIHQLTIGPGGVTGKFTIPGDVPGLESTISGGITPKGVSLGVGNSNGSLTVGTNWKFRSLLLSAKFGKEAGNAVFKAELSPEKYKLSLGFGIGPAMPDVAQMGTILDEGLRSVGRIYRDAGSLNGLSDPVQIAEAVSEHIEPLKKAGDVVGQMAKHRANKTYWRFELGVTGPEPGLSSPAGVPLPMTGAPVDKLKSMNFTLGLGVMW